MKRQILPLIMANLAKAKERKAKGANVAGSP